MDNKLVIHGSVLCILISVCIYTRNPLPYVFLIVYMIFLHRIHKKRNFKHKRIYIWTLIVVAIVSAFFSTAATVRSAREQACIEKLSTEEKLVFNRIVEMKSSFKLKA